MRGSKNKQPLEEGEKLVSFTEPRVSLYTLNPLTTIPHDAIFNTIFNLDIPSLGAFMQTSKTNYTLVNKYPKFWIQLGQEKYWDDLGAPENKGRGYDAMYYKERFKGVHAEHLDIINPSRVERRNSAIREKQRKRVKKINRAWYHLGMGPVWECLFFLSLFGWFVFVPVYLDEFIPGFEAFHLFLFLIIPFLQVLLNAFISFILAFVSYYEVSDWEGEFPVGFLTIAIVPYFIWKKEKDIFPIALPVFLWVSGFFAIFILTAVGIIPYWTPTFSMIWVFLGVPSGVLIYFLVEDNQHTFDIVTFGITVGCFIGWLMLLPMKIDGFVDWHWGWIFFPLVFGEFYCAFLVPIFVIIGDECGSGGTFSEIQSNVGPWIVFVWTNCVFLIYFEVFTVLKLQNEFGYWTVVWIPMWIFLLGSTMGWFFLYGDSLSR